MVIECPLNFSWLEEGKIAALAFPYVNGNFEYLLHHGIRYLITLTREMRPCVENFPEMNHIDISVDDYNTFTLEQIQQFIEVCECAVQKGQVCIRHK